MRSTELPDKLVSAPIHFDNGAEIAIGDDDPAVEIEVDGVWMVEIGYQSRRDIVCRRPVLIAGNKSIDRASDVDSQDLMDRDRIGSPATDLRPIDGAETVAEQIIRAPVSVAVE